MNSSSGKKKTCVVRGALNPIQSGRHSRLKYQPSFVNSMKKLSDHFIRATCSSRGGTCLTIPWVSWLVTPGIGIRIPQGYGLGYPKDRELENRKNQKYAHTRQKFGRAARIKNPLSKTHSTRPYDTGIGVIYLFFLFNQGKMAVEVASPQLWKNVFRLTTP